MKRWQLVSVVVTALAVAAGLTWGWYQRGLQPVAETGDEIVVHVATGSGAVGIAEQLQSGGLIRNARAFRIMLGLTGLGARLKAGHYALSPAMTAQEIADRIASGDVATRRVTIPEGLRLEQIADRIAEADVADREDFLEAAVPRTVAEEIEMPLPDDSLEGYLFPETYDFRYDDGPRAIVLRMVREMQRRFFEPNREEVEARGLSLHEIITLASLVEREAKVDDERALIAGVLQHRLDIGMKLQCDATVQYALGKHRQRLLFDDLEVASPYNTYRHKGLPPGPIASPGLPSLMAALRPRKTDALFYVARPDGTHAFSRSYEEHRQAIREIRGGQ